MYPRAGTLSPFCLRTKLKNFSHLEKAASSEDTLEPSEDALTHSPKIQMSPLGIESHTSVHVSMCIKSRGPGPLVLYCVLCCAADGRPVRFMWAGPSEASCLFPAPSCSSSRSDSKPLPHNVATMAKLSGPLLECVRYHLLYSKKGFFKMSRNALIATIFNYEISRFHVLLH